MPPRLITGITLLFWGGLTGHALLGLLAALLTEGKSWISLQWKFSQTTYVRAWHYSILCGALIAIIAWLNGTKVREIHFLFVWAPLIFLPIELAMRYGEKSTIPLSTFSFFTKKQSQKNQPSGYIPQARQINTGYPYIALTLLATTIGAHDEMKHFIGLALIIGTLLLFNAKKHGLRPFALGLSLVAILVLAFAGHWGLILLNNWYYHQLGGSQPGGRHISSNEMRTSIGQLGQLKLSSEIFWRMQVNQEIPPHLLRVSTYNQYSRGIWKYRPKRQGETSLLSDNRDAQGYIMASQITDHTTRTSNTQSDILLFDASLTSANFSSSPDLLIVGKIDAKIKENPIPIPDRTLAIGGISNLGPEASIESNTAGTVRLVNPMFNVIEYRIWRNHKNPISPTDTHFNSLDLQIPEKEKLALKRVGHSLGLDNPSLSTREKIKRLRSFFLHQCSYSTYLTIPQLSRDQRLTAIGNFLEVTRRGHCEYFATATTLLLRQAGIPARYCVGFSVQEYDIKQKEWVMRGKHAHAWCRVWISDDPTNTHQKGHWEDLDLTPPSWTSMENISSLSWQQKILDWWLRLREDFSIWRTHQNNKSRVTTIFFTLLACLSFWILWKLWQSHTFKKTPRRRGYTKPKDSPVTPLHKLESRLTKHLGPRPVGTSLVSWFTNLSHHHPEWKNNIEQIAKLHNTMRFDPNGISDEEKLELSKLCQDLTQKLKSIK